MDWLDEIEARANLVVKNHEDWSVADAVMLAGHDVPKLIAEIRRLRTVEESLAVENTRLRAELEAAKQDISNMLQAEYAELCAFCKNVQDEVCWIGNCRNAEWRGPCAENGGAK